MIVWSVLAAAIAGMALGAVWYSPVGLGQAWMDALGKSAADLGNPAPAMVGSMLSCLVSALVVEYLFVALALSGPLLGAALGAGLGCGLVATAMASDALFSGWSLRLYLIQAGYRVSYLLVMGVSCGLWPR